MPSASVRHVIGPEIEYCRMVNTFERMNIQRMHIIPLASQGMQVLRTLQIISGRQGLHFRGERGA